MQITVPKVNKEEAKKFSGVWTNKGIAMVMNDVHFQFASDFANVCLQSFVRGLLEQQAKEEAAKVPKVAA